MPNEVSEEGNQTPTPTVFRRGSLFGGYAQNLLQGGQSRRLPDERSEPSCWRRLRTPSPFSVFPMLLLPSLAFGAMPVFQRIAVDFYGSDAQLYFNANVGAKGILALFTGPLVGALSDRWGRKPLLIMQAIMTATPGVLLWALDLTKNGHSYGIYLIMSGASGIQGHMFAIVFAYIADTSSPEQRAKMMGMILGLGFGAGGIISPIFWAQIDTQFGVQVCMRIYAGVLMAWVFLTLLLPESNGREQRLAASLPPLTARDLNPFRYFRILAGGHDAVILSNGSTVNSVFRKVFAVVFFLYVAKMGFLLSLGLYAQSHYNFTVVQTSYLQTVYHVTTLISQIFLFAILAAVSQRMACGLGVTAGMIAGVILSVPNAPGGSLYFVEAPLAVSFITFTVCSALMTKLSPKEIVGEASGLLMTAMSICEGVGPIAFGTLVKAFEHTAYPQAGFLIFTAVMFGGIVVSTTLPRDDVIAKRCLDIKLEAECKATKDDLATAYCKDYVAATQADYKATRDEFHSATTASTLASTVASCPGSPGVGGCVSASENIRDEGSVSSV